MTKDINAKDACTNASALLDAADAALFLAPLAVRFGWDLAADPRSVAEGLLVGHLLECCGQLTGGYYADGARKTVPDLAHLGFPYADVTADGRAVYRKLPGTGGRLDTSTVVGVAAHFRVPPAAVTITAVPRLGALTLVVRGALAGGVTRSGRIDPHGKTLSGHLLDLRIPWHGTGQA